MPANQVDELATVLRLRFELDDDHDLAHGVPFSMILGIVEPYATLRQAPVPRTAGDSTIAYFALRTIMPIAGWPEERAREVEISVGADPVPWFGGMASPAEQIALTRPRPFCALTPLRSWGRNSARALAVGGRGYRPVLSRFTDFV